MENTFRRASTYPLKIKTLGLQHQSQGTPSVGVDPEFPGQILLAEVAPRIPATAEAATWKLKVLLTHALETLPVRFGIEGGMLFLCPLFSVPWETSLQ